MLLNGAGCATSSVVPSAQQAADRHQTLGDQFYERKRFTEALREWRLAYALDPTRREIAERIETVGSGRAWQLQDAVPSGENNPRLRQELAAAEEHYQESRVKDAEVAWRRVLEWNNGQPEAVAGLERLAAEAYEADSRRSFDQMTRELYEEGMRAFRRQEWERAELKLAEAEKLNADQPQVRRYLDKTRLQLAQKKQTAEAEALQRQALSAEAAGQWVAAYRHWQALAQGTQPSPPEAVQGLERCQPRVAEWAKAQNAAAERLLADEKYPAALTRFQQVLEMFPGDSRALRGQDEARRATAQARTQAASEGEGRRRFNAGVACYRRNDLAAAIREWELAVAASPEDAEYREWLSRAKKELIGRDTQNRQRAEARYADGLAAYQRGELDDALAAWKEVLELDPGHEKARMNIQKIEKEMK
ncbi:MAG: tetratricopeptide repeat protein [candidate division FCPU426 bacterium]